MTIQVRRLPLEHIAGKAKERRVFEEIEKRLRSIEKILFAAIETDPVQGRLRVKAALVPAELGSDPTLVSTFGHVGEVRRLGGVQYVKQGLTGEDTNWTELADTDALGNLIVIQTTEPTAAIDSSLFWIDSSKTPWMLHVLTSFDGGTSYDYDATPFDYYSATQPTASRTSPGRFVDISANPSVFKLKLQNGSGDWYYARQGAGLS